VPYFPTPLPPAELAGLVSNLAGATVGGSAKVDTSSRAGIFADTAVFATVTMSIDRKGHGFRKLEAIQRYLENMTSIPNGPMEVSGRHAVHMIKRRMSRGMALDGTRFKMLEEYYAKRKTEMIKKGAHGAGVPSEKGLYTMKPPTSNLFLTGKLYGSIRTWKSRVQLPGVRQGAPGMTVGVSVDKGFAQKMNKERPFLGLTDSEVGILSREFMRNVRVGIGKIK